jgi:hypothetical protein
LLGLIAGRTLVIDEPAKTVIGLSVALGRADAPAAPTLAESTTTAPRASAQRWARPRVWKLRMDQVPFLVAAID